MAKSALSHRGWIWLFVIIVVIVAAVLLYFYFKGKNANDAPKTKTPKPIKKPTTPPPPGVPKWVPEKFPLNVGMYGAYIQQLQAALGITQDGKFGTTETKPAVLAKGYNVPLSEADYNKLAIIGQPVYAYSDGILILNGDFSANSGTNVKTDDFLGNIVGISGASYLVDPTTSNPPINATGNIYVQKADVYFGDLNKN